MPRQSAVTRLRLKTYEVFEHDQLTWTGKLVGHAIVLLVVVNLAAMIFASVPDLEARFGRLFDLIEVLSVAAFAVEYLLRVWVAVEHRPYRELSPLRARLAYMTSAAGLVDLLAVLPFIVAPLFPADMRAIVLFGVIRFFKLARYSSAVRSLLIALFNERRTLLGCFVVLIGATISFASVMYLLERGAQPDKFGTIPDAMWWAIVTLCTIGYGDVVPITPAGKLVAGATIIAGLMIFALPIAIIASAFSEEVRRHNFIVTWSMVARVPLFAEMGAAEISDIMQLLRAQVVEPGRVIVRRGDAANCMYFIAAGEVQVDLPGGHVRLGIGQFFGEIALLRRSTRSATVVAVTRTNLLVLDAHDFHALMKRSPEIARHVEEIAATRIGGGRVTPKGDIVAQEIVEAEPEKEAGPEETAEANKAG